MNISEVELLARIYDIKKKYKPIQHVYVEINKKPVLWEEEDVRAYQILIHDTSEGEYEYLKDTVIIYSGPYKPGSHKMIIRKDGKFENEFDEGFFDGNANMAFEIF